MEKNFNIFSTLFSNPYFSAFVKDLTKKNEGQKTTVRQRSERGKGLLRREGYGEKRPEELARQKSIRKNLFDGKKRGQKRRQTCLTERKTLSGRTEANGGIRQKTKKLVRRKKEDGQKRRKICLAEKKPVWLKKETCLAEKNESAAAL